MKDEIKLQAMAGCCEEASPKSVETYIPCNKPATKVVKLDREGEFRMCDGCAHNYVDKHGAKIIGDYSPPPPAMGDNNPPPFDTSEVEKLDAEGAGFLEAAAQWIEHGEIKTEDEAQNLNDFVAGVKARAKIAEDARVKAKKPHDEAAAAVQKAFKPVIEKMKEAAKQVQPQMTAWLNLKEKRRLAEVERARLEAAQAQEEADRKALLASERNDISGQVDAAAAKKEADEIAKAAERLNKTRSNVSSASGGGRTVSLRTEVVVEVVSSKLLFMRYMDRPEVIECLRSLAAREAKTKDFTIGTDQIAGAKISTRKVAV